MFDLNAEIEPWKGLGGIKLYTHISELRGLLLHSTKAIVLANFYVKYEIGNKIYLWFNLLNGKLYQLSAYTEYKGGLFTCIHIGMSIPDVLMLEPTFVYDDFEEIYESHRGVILGTAQGDDKVRWISVFIKEMKGPDFESGNW